MSFFNKKKEILISDSSTKANIPSSCRDLATAGNSFDGLYLVRNSDTNKIETVFCQFRNSVSQEVIGSVDVKSKSVHFYVTRNSTFHKKSEVITWELERLNVGGGMNLASGIFTAPVAGIYHFEFSGLKDSSDSYLEIFLQVNRVNMGVASTDQIGSASTDSVSLTASLRLIANDRVGLLNGAIGALFDNNKHQSHFAGWLVEEDLI